MLTDSSNVALWGKLGMSAKTVAMGTAGVALWGSLAFFFFVGDDGSETKAAAGGAERLFLRMELPETALLDGCTENFGGADCTGQAWVIISENRDDGSASGMPAALEDKLPEPLWNEVVARHSISEAQCRDTLTEELPKWLSSGARDVPGLHATLLPDRFTACQGIASDIDPMRDVQAFWIMSDHRVVAEVRCTMPGGDMDSECQLSAFPEHGGYVVSYSRLPASNIQQIVAQSSGMLAIVADNLPEEVAAHVNLAFLDGRIALDDATAHAVTSLRGMVR
ncbi:hypothetical protein OB2597_08719 [Pseudooceanicola batsensis HTCC2597]|uniref:Uncharacterized protein n=1 Tax=Pseudooceanicola batsensis (strain ATCC BAA-863 / DSM 15984 / KCTC 12145 / HTCC2597) TaxID=252305 RepID=A3TUL6_PSEBH|nr:hypothetical protein [Pseudooceanicola batsensis]EAQ04212.1 hypothetical protein OB2597_08719 [Pseudooceanicola batsensis HTCC2597]